MVGSFRNRAAPALAVLGAVHLIPGRRSGPRRGELRPGSACGLAEARRLRDRI